MASALGLGTVPLPLRPDEEACDRYDKPCGFPPKTSGISSAAIEEASKRRVIRMPPRPLATPRRGWAMNLCSQTAKRKRGSLPCACKAEALTFPCVAVHA